MAERLAGYYANAETITQRAIWAGEHAGDVVRTAHPYGGYVDVMLTNVDIAASGVLAADEERVWSGTNRSRRRAKSTTITKRCLQEVENGHLQSTGR